MSVPVAIFLEDRLLQELEQASREPRGVKQSGRWCYFA